jgi:hypothetical protein
MLLTRLAALWYGSLGYCITSVRLVGILYYLARPAIESSGLLILRISKSEIPKRVPGFAILAGVFIIRADAVG